MWDVRMLSFYLRMNVLSAFGNCAVGLLYKSGPQPRAAETAKRHQRHRR